MLAQSVMEADGTRSEQEAAVMRHFQQELSLPPDHVPTAIAEAEALATFDTPRNRRVALLELSAIAVADKLDDTELALLGRYAQALSLTTLELDAMLDWSARQLLLVAEAGLLLSGEV
ncbi:MAG: hypothetical protein JHC88_19590 [Niveispirillum sp.]|nr:hypothetical protein [Niveispirillum sp.]